MNAIRIGMLLVPALFALSAPPASAETIRIYVTNSA